MFFFLFFDLEGRPIHFLLGHHITHQEERQNTRTRTKKKKKKTAASLLLSLLTTPTPQYSIKKESEQYHRSDCLGMEIEGDEQTRRLFAIELLGFPTLVGGKKGEHEGKGENGEGGDGEDCVV